MAETKIQWADKTWNPITGCTPCSPGCKNCYAKRMAQRLRGRCGYPADDPFRVTYHADRIDQPKHWRKPARIFTCSMSDLFHEDVSFNDIDTIFRVMRECPQHTFLVLTKRAYRLPLFDKESRAAGITWPSNLHLGVSVCTQDEANEKTQCLLATSAPIKFLSLEPLLEPIIIEDAIYTAERLPESEGWGLDWIVAGCEKIGHHPGRYAKHGWFGDLAIQCRLAGVSYFCKQIEREKQIVYMPKLYPGALDMPELDGKVYDQLPETN